MDLKIKKNTKTKIAKTAKTAKTKKVAKIVINNQNNENLTNKNNNSNTNSNNTNSNNTSKTKNETKKEFNSKNLIIKPFNKELSKQIKNVKFLNKNNNKLYKDEIEKYQNSFENIIEFSKKITSTKKKAINCIIFHAENSDGIMSANIALKFLLENKKTDIHLIPAKPSSGSGKLNYRITQHQEKIKNKNILILDLQYNQEMLEYFKKYAKNVYVIDDHNIANSNNSNYFIGNGDHAAVAYTWKFFYPKKDVPIYYQIIDNDDRKLQLPYLNKYRSMTSFLNYRLFHSPYLKINFNTIEDFKNLDYAINGEFDNISTIIGHYYDELANNIKEQVARNARKATFQGHPVYVLNYNDPVLSRMVARQMLSNAQKKGDNIHFAVLWGYEYTNNCYRVQLCEFHGGKPKYNLPYMAKTLGNIGKTTKAGGGAAFVGNFYWPRNKYMDIWDLFSKNYIKNKMN